MSPSPKPEVETDETPEMALVTPRVFSQGGSGSDHILLSPPPAPMGCAYNDNDILTTSRHGENSCITEQRQGSNSRELDVSGILEFPSSLRNIQLSQPPQGLNLGDDTRDVTATPIDQMIGRRRRAASFDGVACPRIALRPRFSSSFQQWNDWNDNEDGNHDNNNMPSASNGRGHRRYHSYTGVDKTFSFDSIFGQDVPVSSLPLLPSIPSVPSGLDLSQLNLDLPSSSPKTSTFIDRSTINTDMNYDRFISRPIPRYNNNANKVSSTPPPPPIPYNERRLLNTSEGTTSCTLSSSSQSAFGTPSKQCKNPNSPLSSTSGDSGSSSSRRNELAGERGNRSSGPTPLPYFPQESCNDDDYFVGMVSVFYSSSLSYNSYSLTVLMTHNVVLLQNCLCIPECFS